MKKSVVSALSALAITGAGAKTVALWPLAWNYEEGKADVRCAVDPANDLTAAAAVKSMSAQPSWQLPPNPDASSFLFTPAAGLGSIASGTSQGYLTSPTAGVYLSPSRSFTLEGWMKLDSVAAVGGEAWSVLAGPSLSGSNGFMLSIRKDQGKCYPRITTYIGTSSSWVDKPFPDANYSESSLSEWNHWALTYLPDNGTGNSVYTFYLNGVSAGSVTAAAVTTKLDNSGSLNLGARPLGNTIKGALRYVRISDEVLTTDEFLCATGSAPVSSPTAAYWKLGRDSQGGIDVLPSVGSAPLQYGFYNTAYDKCGLSTDAEGAFSGQPANSTVTIPGGNKGSFRGEGKFTTMQFAGLGSQLAHDKDFTVEMWMKPELRNAGQYGVKYLFGKQTNGRGWTLTMNVRARTATSAPGIVFRMNAIDAQGAALGEREIGGLIKSWSDWKHVALVHTASGNGSWKLYLDGILHGTLDNPRVVEEDAAVTVFNFAGLAGNQGFCGKIDCARVCAAALAPEQFLCAKNGSPADNVLAFWPLEYADNGAYPVMQDLVGSYTIGAVPTTTYRAVPQADCPTITNPDKTETIRDNPTNSNGSVGFRSYDGSGANALLYSVEPNAVASLKDGDAGFTVETYLNPATANGWQLIFIASASATIHNNGTPGTRIWFRREADNTLKLTDWSFLNKQDITFGPATLTENKWQHVAVTFHIEGENGVWVLYIDGKEKGRIEGPVVRHTDTTADYNWFAIGGRYGFANTFTGKMAHMRISRGVLNASQFLCATGAEPVQTPVVTRAYWPLDWNGSALDLASRVNAGYPLEAQNAVGTAAQARGRIPNVDDGCEKRNRGSVILNGNGSLTSARAGEALDLDRAFTVEGWMLWKASAETVCGTFYNDSDWKLSLDANGVFHIFARGAVPLTACVDKAFDGVNAVSGDWMHVALSYDPMVGNGIWTLFVNGKQCTSVENDWRTAAVSSDRRRFILGGMTTGTMDYDLWRISVGCRTADSFLYGPRMGLFMVVK